MLQLLETKNSLKCWKSEGGFAPKQPQPNVRVQKNRSKVKVHCCICYVWCSKGAIPKVFCGNTAIVSSLREEQTKQARGPSLCFMCVKTSPPFVLSAAIVKDSLTRPSRALMGKMGLQTFAHMTDMCPSGCLVKWSLIDCTHTDL